MLLKFCSSENKINLLKIFLSKGKKAVDLKCHLSKSYQITFIIDVMKAYFTKNVKNLQNRFVAEIDNLWRWA